MQHGYEVVSFQYKGTTIYGVVVDGVVVSFDQIKHMNIPQVGKVAKSIVAKTKKNLLVVHT
jgi:regulator of RNase E activity RraA